jgi:hypothetical protein
LDTPTMLDPTEVADIAAVVNGPEDEPLDWDAIQWRHAEENVRRLHHRVGGLLPDRGVQTCFRRVGRTPVEAGLQMGLVLPFEQVDALGDRPVLRQVQPGQAAMPLS